MNNKTYDTGLSTPVIYVVDKNGNALAPCSRPGHVRHLLREHKAKVIGHDPFTIKLGYVPGTTSY